MSLANEFAFSPAIERELRAQIRRDLVDHVPPELVDEVIDLCFHAANTASAQVDQVLSRGSHPGIYITGLGIAISLVKGRCDQMIAALRDYASAEGLPTKECRMTAGGAQ